jgi:protein involved in polysaccharide export with SLBB domain
MGIAMNRRHGDAEPSRWRYARDRLAHALAIAGGIEEQADGMSARRLLEGKIDHMAEQTAERCAKDVDDPQRARTRHLTQLRKPSRRPQAVATARRSKPFF